MIFTQRNFVYFDRFFASILSIFCVNQKTALQFPCMSANFADFFADNLLHLLVFSHERFFSHELVDCLDLFINPRRGSTANGKKAATAR